MPTNIEIKAVIHDWAAMCRRAESLSDTPVELIEQEDTFFVCPTGRLKLRFLAPNRGQLIAYQRDDVSGTKASRYLITETTEPVILRQVLAASLGILGTVKKKRFLYLRGQTRIHLDQVEMLGTFLELEVVLRPDQPSSEGEAIARDLMEKLDIHAGDLLAGAYLDRILRSDPAWND